MKSLVKRLWTAQSIQTADANSVSPATFPQRIRDESGAVQITLNQNPTASAGARLRVQGRMKSSLPYSMLADITLNHADFAASPFSRIITGIQIVPDMRVIVQDGGGGYTVAAGTTATVDLME